ncbi:hypothetical protein ACVLV4_002934 [Rathayibacter agropyri]
MVAAFLDPSRFWAWALCDVAIVVAHGLSIVVKRVVRRPRPHGEGVQVLGTAPSKLSLPSSRRPRRLPRSCSPLLPALSF